MWRLESGGIIGVSARGMVEDAINIGTLGIPGIGVHHVGILSRHSGRLLFYESTTGERPPDYFTGHQETGVGARPIEQIQEFFAAQDAKLWYYPLRCPLYEHEERRLDEWLTSKVGLPYDLDGALHSGGGLLFRTLSILLRGEDLASLFCSEMCMGALAHVGRIRTSNASKWSPNKSCRYLVRTGTCGKPQLIS